jgi:hypothetical protein
MVILHGGTVLYLSISVDQTPPPPHPHHHQYDLTDPFLYISYCKTGAAVSLCYQEKYSILFSKIHNTFLPWTKGQGRPVHFLLVTLVFFLKNKRPTHFSTSFSCHKSYDLCYLCFFVLTLSFFACTSIRFSMHLVLLVFSVEVKNVLSRFEHFHLF